MEQEIAERAKKYALNMYPELNDDELSLFSDCRRDYAHGAREQHKIDIEKACEWLKHRGATYAVDVKDSGEVVIDDKCLLYNFRKAMEE